MDEMTSDRFRAPAPGTDAPSPADTPFVGAPVNLPRRITTPLGPAPTLPPPPSYSYTAPATTYSYTVPPMPYPAQADQTRPAYIMPPTAPATRPARKSGFGPAMLTGTLALGLIMGSVGGGVTAWYLDHNGGTGNGNTVTITTAPSAPAAGNPVTGAGQAPAGGLTPSGVADGSSNAIGALYNKVANSVVSIHTTDTNAGPTGGGGEGTGIVVDKTHVLTNYHVVQGSDTIRIVLIDGSSVMGKLAGSAPQDDLAVVTADLPADKVTPAVFGDSSAVKVGDEVVAIGDPFGLDHSVTAGIISAVNRDWQTGGRPMRGMIQTDAPINPGNSGGPLFNLQGQVIGITTSIESPVRGSVGVGFAIPSNRATSLLPQLSGGEKVQRPWLGISGQAIDDEVASQLNLPVKTGVLVVGVVSGAPAEKAGLHAADTAGQGGDIVTAIDGHAVGRVEDLTGYLDNKKAGDTVTLTVLRNGSKTDIKVTLEAWPDEMPQSSTDPNAPDPNMPDPTDPNTQPGIPNVPGLGGGLQLGILGENLTAARAQQLKLGVTAGVLVRQVLPGSAAETAGLQGSTSSTPGDVITAIDGKPVLSNTDIGNAVRTHQSGDTLTVTVWRDGKSTDLKLTLGR